MKTRYLSSSGIPYAIIFLIVFSVARISYSQVKSESSGTSGSVSLAYKFHTDKAVKYLATSKINQVMDINGQPMQNNITSAMGCRIKSAGTKEKNLILEITVDTMAQSIESQMGNAGGPIAEAAGKVFNIVITPEGKETDLSEAEKIAISNQSGSGNMAQSFIDFFLDLPAGAVKPGHMWITTDSITTGTSSNTMKQVVKYENKLEGFEKNGDFNCARISSVLTGTMNIKTQSQGMDLVIAGPFTGTGILLFAIDEGYVIKQTTTSKVTGNIQIVTPEPMTFPIVMDVTSVIEVVK